MTDYFPVSRLLTKFLSVQDNVAEIREFTFAKNTTHFCYFLEVDKDIFKSFLSVPATRSVLSAECYNKIFLLKLFASNRAVLKVHKIENFFDSDFGICVISLLVMSKY